MNRLSLGAQASQTELLTILGRIHTWQQVEDAVKMAQDNGFSNLNLDLMLGLPGQSVTQVRQTLEQALALSPTHLSCYGLIVEEGTRMQQMLEKGHWQLPDEGTERQMYELCREMLQQHGMMQYEISNFALPGYTCRHNVDCWKRKEYLGLGSAACSFLNEKRITNPASIDDYLSGLSPEILSISPEEARFESIMLGLRMMEGVSNIVFQETHGMSIQEAFGDKMKKPLEMGLLCWDGDHLRLTRRGMDLQNMVLVEFL